MLDASQDIDYFIERQRSKLNKEPNRQQVNRQQTNRQRLAAPPAPPPPPRQPPTLPSTNLDDRLDFKVARILNEPSPRNQSRQTYIPPSPRPIATSPYPESQSTSYDFEQQPRHVENDARNNTNNNQFGFFDRFGAHAEKRAQLKDDLKREYNDFLRSQHGPKHKSTSQPVSTREKTTRRVQFAENGKVVAPWEKNGDKKTTNVSNVNDIFSSSTTTTEYTTNRARSRLSEVHDEQYIRDREEYILELYEQIRELEARRRQLELESSKLSAGNSSSVTRAHYTEDLNALNSLLAERLNQRSAIDHELARILNRPPVSSSSASVITGGGPNLNISFDSMNDSSPQRNQQQNRNDNRSKRNNDDGFQIGHDKDKETEQAAKKRYQQELLSQMREAKMRKAQAKQEKDEYERKLEVEINRYNYFGRSGGGAPMRDKDGNVVANLGDLRNPQQQQQQQYISPQGQQPYTAIDDKIYSLGAGPSSITNAPFYNGDKQNPSNSDRSGSPNHARGAVSNGIFGTIKTDEQLVREERYKQDLKRQIDEKRQRNAEELTRRRADEEREIAKHIEWQQQVEKQTAEEASRKQEKEAQERQHQQRLQEELGRQKQQEEIAIKRKSKRPEKSKLLSDDNNEADRQNTYDEQQSDEPVYRSSSPPVPTIKNKDKKQKSNHNVVRHQSFDDENQEQLPPIIDDNELIQPPIDDDDDGHVPDTYRKPPTPKQPDVPPARKKPPQTHRPRLQANFNNNGPFRTNSTASLRSDGSDSEVLNRLEHLKRQLKDKEARLQQHSKSQAALLSDIEEQTAVSYRPPSLPHSQRKQSPGYMRHTAQFPYQTVPSAHDKLLRVLQTDDDDEFKPSYFRDDSILMRGGGGGGGGLTGGEYISPSKRVDLVDGIFVTNIEDTARRRRDRYDFDPPGFYDRDDPTNMANLELNRIAEQNEHRLKKLRELEKDDTSLLDSNEVLERFQQKQRLQRRGSQTTLQDDAWLK
ncbi:unnamed protein product [Rotaria socialis]|uniref:Centrosome and spindle pole-associated protein 1 n=1 Tax=Rotaria socialis TaxID=392032 RepID=A0A817TB00_9BILA|nr:unnamed protein product [Rotaria socialis]CAF4444315.1 unnamed protein product [Rotaria socialis]